MKTYRTVFMSLGIFAVMILAVLSSYVDQSLVQYNTRYFRPYAMLTGIAGANLILAAAFCVLVWFMLRHDTGDRIPPVLMLALGLLGLLVPFLYTKLPLSVITVPFFSNTPASFTSALFVAFGVAGLLIKPAES